MAYNVSAFIRGKDSELLEYCGEPAKYGEIYIGALKVGPSNKPSFDVRGNAPHLSEKLENKCYFVPTIIMIDTKLMNHTGIQLYDSILEQIMGNVTDEIANRYQNHGVKKDSDKKLIFPDIVEEKDLDLFVTSIREIKYMFDNPFVSTMLKETLDLKSMVNQIYTACGGVNDSLPEHSHYPGSN